MSRGRRSLLPLVAVVLVAALPLAACGDEPEETAADASTRQPVTVEHALGTTTVPADPERIVVTNPYSLLDYLLAVGLTPVASAGDPGAAYPFGAWLKGKADAIEVIGGSDALDLEQVAALRPDLILADPWREEEHPQLSRIAPTVAVPLDYADYVEELRFVARVVGREAEAEKRIAEHRDLLRGFRERLPKPAPVVSVARVFPANGRVEAESYVTTLLAAAGLRRPAAHERLTEDLEFSPEQLRQIDGDELFVYSGSNAAEDEANRKALARLQRNPLWDRLDAVRSGNVHLVDSYLWGGGGILWANAVLADVQRRLGS